MVLTFKIKEILVNKIHNIINKSTSIAIADIHKVTANEINELRKISHDNIDKIYFLIIKNSLLNLALKNSKFYYINSNLLKGHILLGFTFEDPTMIAKLFNNLYKKNDNFIIKCIALDNKLFTTISEIDFINKLPSKKENLIKIIFILKYFCIGKLLIFLKLIIQKNKK